MKRLALAVMFMFLTGGLVEAAGGPFGLGVMIGEPTGISAKYWIGSERQRALDLGAAWSLSGDNEFQFHGDYLFHEYQILQNALQIQKGRLPLYFGIGGRVKFREDEDDKVGIRIPVGTSYIFPELPIDVFAEIVPVVNVAPDTEMDVVGGVGIRFYF